MAAENLGSALVAVCAVVSSVRPVLRLLMAMSVNICRPGPPPQLAQENSSNVYPERDPNLDQRQQHALMAKASGWDPGIVNVRAIQQAYDSLQV